MTADHPLTLTVEQAAEVLGVARSTAYELVRSGDIESVRLRRRIVVPTKALAEKLAVSVGDVWAVLTPTRSRPAAESAPPATSRPSASQPSLFEGHHPQRGQTIP